jgi:L-lactate dehydrogenase complex protein LldG
MTFRNASDSAPGRDAARATQTAPADEPVLELLVEFTGWASALGVDVERLEDSDAAAGTIARLATASGTERTVLSTEVARQAPGLVAALDRAGVPCREPEAAAQTQHERFGVSFGHLAIAETGSVLMAEDRLEDRAVGMLVAVQVIVCRTASLVPSLDDAAPVLREYALQPGGAYTTLVTGPSRTADIERVLTVGVQGPGRLVILFVDDLA